MEGNLVSHQTVGNYLKEELDVDVKQRGEANIENSRGTITGLVGRLNQLRLVKLRSWWRMSS